MKKNNYFKQLVRLQHAGQYVNSTSALKPYSAIPQPKRLPILGTVLDYTKFRKFNPMFINQFLKNRHEQLGPIFKETIIPGLTDTLVYTSDPGDVEAMFRNDARMPVRPAQMYMTKGREHVGINTGILNTQEEDWYRLRRLYNEHLLTNKSIWSYVQDQLEVSFDLVDYIERNLDDKQEVPDFDDVLYRWGLESTSVFALDSKLGTLQNEVSSEAQAVIDSTIDLFQSWADLAFAVPIWKYVDTKDVKKLYKHQRAQHDAIWQFMKTRPNHGSGRFEKIVSESNLSQSEKDVIVFDVLAAGVDTTSNAAAFLLYCLAANPEKQEILREEVKQVLGSEKELTGRIVHQMKYMHAVNMEAQRLFPLVQGIIRKTATDLALSGYDVPAGSMVILTANIVNNKDSKYYDDPDVFRPERWLDSKTKPNRFAMSGSFGIGARMCPGRRFALQELSCLAVALLSRYRIEYHYEPFETVFRIVSKPTEKSRFSFVPLEK